MATKDSKFVAPSEDGLKALLAGLSAKDIAASGDLSNVSEILARLEVRKRLKEAMEEDQVESDRVRAYEASLKNVEDEINARMNNQAMCPHIKQNGRAALVGQRASHGKPIYLCQNCQKIWINESVPPHLAITMDNDMIGGPA